MHEHGYDIELASWGRSSLIGRDDEVEHLTHLVRRPDVRLVTVTGRSGVGKSAVVSRVAAVIATEDGVGIARAQVDRHAAQAGVDELVAVLSLPSDGPAGPVPAGRRRVVLLDGLEAVSGAAALVRDALAADEGLAVLASSIVALSLPGEQVVRLEPLPLPRLGESDLAALHDVPAVRLLRARIAEASGREVEDDLPSIVALARLVDGLPLTLELVAARCAELPVAQVREQLERLTPIGVLVDDAAPVEHHRSLRATILWSYELLDPEHRRTLRRLGVFAGSFSPRTAAAVSEGPADHLDQLVAGGLAREAAGGTTDRRFELVPSVSHVARELLAAEDDLTASQDRHAEHFVAVAHDATITLRSPATPQVRRRLLEDLDDIVAAVRHLDLRGRREDALRLMVDLALMWEESNASALGAQVLAELLPDLSGENGVDPFTSAEAWALAVMVAVWAQQPFERRGDLLHGLGRASVAVRRAGTSPSLLMVIRSQVARSLLEGEPIAATAAADEGLALARGLGDAWWTCQFLGWSAAAYTMAGDPTAARRLAVEGRDLALTEGDTAQLLRLSHLLLGIGDSETDPAAPPVGEVELIGLARRVDDVHAEGVLHVGAAVQAVARGDVTAAADHLLAALDLGRQRGLWYLEELSLLATVVLATAAGRPVEAARLHGAMAEVLPGLQHAIAPEATQLYEFMIDQAHVDLGEPDFEVAVARGRLLEWDEATIVAMAVCDELSVVPTTPAPGGPTAGAGPVDLLSPRQTQVLGLLAHGCTNKEIAIDLGMRPKTVMHHTSEIYRRLGVRNRTEAVAEAHRLRLVTSPS